jgi:hypothetical protein
LFDLLRGPAACLAGPVRWRGLLVAAIDGTILSVADSPANLTVFAKQRGGSCGGGSYPSLRLVALVACGTRTLIDVVFGPTSHGETTYAHHLVHAARAGMLILADRNFAAGRLFAASWIRQIARGDALTAATSHERRRFRCRFSTAPDGSMTERSEGRRDSAVRPALSTQRC